MSGKLARIVTSATAAAIVWGCTSVHASAACSFSLPTGAITDTNKTFIRKGNGEWNAPRAEGASHTGVDIIVNASYPDNAPYSVFPVAAGTIAYARLNGSPSAGYGNVIVVDHGTGCYSLYAHLASLPFTPASAGSNLLRAVGEKVTVSDRLGYFVDVKADVDSTGNAQSTAPEARHQVHFALIAAPSGRQSTGGLANILKADGAFVDPTALLLSKGYSVQ